MAKTHERIAGGGGGGLPKKKKKRSKNPAKAAYQMWQEFSGRGFKGPKLPSQRKAEAEIREKRRAVAKRKRERRKMLEDIKRMERKSSKKK